MNLFILQKDPRRVSGETGTTREAGNSKKFALHLHRFMKDFNFIVHNPSWTAEVFIGFIAVAVPCGRNTVFCGIFTKR